MNENNNGIDTEIYKENYKSFIVKGSEMALIFDRQAFYFSGVIATMCLFILYSVPCLPLLFRIAILLPFTLSSATIVTTMYLYRKAERVLKLQRRLYHKYFLSNERSKNDIIDIERKERICLILSNTAWYMFIVNTITVCIGVIIFAVELDNFKCLNHNYDNNSIAILQSMSSKITSNEKKFQNSEDYRYVHNSADYLYAAPLPSQNRTDEKPTTIQAQTTNTPPPTVNITNNKKNDKK